ncbi:MAG TPA: DUF4403 family protein [Thermoanaerobaculia bacterium]|nr:DUF4403 family protein [Thermoanaerobaculia bacterium]
MRRRTIITSLFVLACCAGPSSPPPGLVGPSSPPPPPEVSTIAVPIRASLAPLVQQVESRVQNRFTDTVRERGIDIRYEVTRDPIRLTMIGGGLHTHTKVRYALEACRGKFPCVSCGFREARREAGITLHTKLEWDSSWRLRSTTRLLPVDYPKPCEVTWFGIDVTRRFVAPVITEQLTNAAKIIDRNTPALTAIRPRAEEVWTALQNPIELAPRTWLVLDPTDVALTPISGSGSTVTSTLALRAVTRVVVGDKPAIARKPLPPLRVASEGGGMRVPADLQLSYDDASTFLSREVAGKTFRIDGKPLTIETIRIAPAAKGKVLIEAAIDYRGGGLRNYRGLIFLEGTPQFDAATSSIVIPDLEYSLDPKRRGFLAKIAERAAHVNVRDRLRASARFSVAARLGGIRDEITRALTRKLAPGVQLRGRADAIQPVAVIPLAHVLLVRIVATGSAEVSIDTDERGRGGRTSRPPH